MPSRIHALLCILALALPGLALAQAYEPFDYPPGSNLAGANGGTGFSEPWRVTTGGPTTIVTGTASGEIVTGLSYTDALGQSLPVSGGAWKSSSTIQTGQAQRGTLADVGAAGTSVWMSFLVQQAPTTGGTNYAAPTLGTGYASVDPQRMGWGLGGLPNAHIFYIYTAASAAVLDIGNAAGKTTFFVVRIDFNANPALDDSVSIWIDPLLNHDLPPAPDLRGVGAGRNFPDIVNGLSLLFGENREHVFDEVRIGADLGWTVSEAWVVDNTQNIDSAPLRECTGAPGDCSLRGAMARAFDNPGEDEVRFDIPMSDPGCVSATGVCTIDNTNGIGYGDHSATRGITIDGYTQPGASPNTLPVGQGTNAQIKIELANGGFGFAAPFTVRGLAFLGPGMSAARGDSVLDPAVPQQGNPRYQIHGNFFGFRADGVTPTVVTGQFQFLTMDMFRGEIRGIEIGGPDPAQMNVFGGGIGSGTSFCIQLRGTGHRVRGNLIGTDRSGMVAHSCGFQAAIQVQDFAFPAFATGPAAPHWIGGPDPGDGNVISGHRGHAIANDSGAPQGLAIVQGNRIGLAVDGQTPLPNITYQDIFPVPTGAIRGDARATSMLIVDNLFGPNGLTRGRTPATPPFVQTPAVGNDVGVWESRGNRYRGLQGLALDIVRNANDIPPRTPNDAGDADAQGGFPTFGNRAQNFPEISVSSLAGDQLTLSYRVDSLPAHSAYPLSVEFYRDNGRGDLDPIGSDTYLEAEAQQVKQLVLTLPPGITLGAGDVVVGMASTSIVAPNRSGETSETTFYPLESFSFVSLTPATVPAGVPYIARVRVVAAPGAPFKPNGRALIFDGRGGECVAFIEAVAAERTGEGECELVTTGAPGNVSVSASYSASLNAFALATGAHPANVSQQLTLREALVVDTASDNAALQACTAAPNDCSLRGALVKTQRDLAGEDTIEFNIPASDPGCDAGGVCTITLTSAIDLANLVPGIQTGPGQGFTIDGYTQPGASVNTLPLGQGTNAQLKIKLRPPTNSPFVPQIDTHTPFTIRGLIFENVSLRVRRGDGVPLGQPHDSIQRYELMGNFFGVDADGVTWLNAPNLAGTAYVFTDSLVRRVRIGSGAPADINLFAAGAEKPNFCLVVNGGDHRVHGNFIGVDRTGLAGSGCLNGMQLVHQGPNVQPMEIGGSAPGQGNVISRHVLNAIAIDAAERSRQVRIRGNLIGMGVDGVTPAPNWNPNNSVCTAFAAIRSGAVGPTSAQIGGLLPGEGNLFGPNGINRPRCPAPFAQPAPYMQTAAVGEGMGVWQVQGNRYLGMQGMAIDLKQDNDNGNSLPQRLANDAGDADTLAVIAPFVNRLQNFPTISAFSLTGNQVDLTYRVDSAPANSLYPLSIEFLRDDGAGNLTPIGGDIYTAGEAQTDKAISFTLPAGISLAASDIIVATATTTPDGTPGENATGETSETTYHPLESFSLVSITPTTTPSGVPVTVRVRAVAAPGVPFKPNGRVLVQASNGSSPFEECTVLLAPVAAARTSEGECQVGMTAPPSSVGVRVSYNAAQGSFALADGRHPASVLQLVTVTPGVTALELVSGNNQTALVGDAFAEALVVRALGTGGAPLAGVPVQFSGPATGAGASFVPATAVSDVAGLASTTATAIRAGGSYSVTASVGALTQTFTLTNEPGLDTALEIVSHLPNPSVPGQAVTVTTALNSEAGGPAPSGSIAVTANTGEACSIALPATSCALAFATLGERVIQAFYPGDANYTSSKAVFVDHSVANLPSLTINDVSLNEGNSGTTAFVFSVSLQHASGAPVSVDFASANDSAVAPGDYTATNGTLNFAGSTTTQTITVQVAGDTTVEPDERFFVNLSSASGATIADAQGSGTILDDDQPPPPAASIDDVIVQEPVLRGITQTRARFTVSLDRPAPGPVSLRVRTQSGTAIQNQDFDGNDFVLRFTAGQREKVVDVFIREDDILEPTENFFVELSEPQGITLTDALGEGSILDDGPDAALTVNSAADPGNGSCTPSACTLRDAIRHANTLQSVRIGFDIPGSGPHTIMLSAPLPNPGAKLHTIDGYTQPGSRPNAAAIDEDRDLDADQRIIVDASAIGGSTLNLQHGGTIRGLRLQRLSLNVLHQLNARPTRIVGNHISEAGVSIRPDGASSDALVDILVGGVGADRNRLGSLAYGTNNVALRPGTRVRIEGNVIDARIAITDDNSNGIRSIVHLLGNRAPGIDLNPGSSVFEGINPGLQLDSSGNHYSGDPAIAVLPSNFREFRQIHFVNDHYAPGAQAAVIHAHSQAGNSHRVQVVPATMGIDPAVIDLGADGPTGNDPGDFDSGPNDRLNYPELLSATYNDRGERLRIRYRLEPDGVGDGYVAHFYARTDDRLEWLGARAYLGGIDEFDLTLPRRLPLDTEIHALTEFEDFAGITSERSANPVAVTGNQLLAQAAATRENTGLLRFAIRSELPLAAPQTLRYRSIDGSALAGSDYTAVDGSVQAPAGEFEVFVDVPLLNDTLVERDESFKLEVWSDEDFSLGSALATATIVDDDVSRREVRQFDTLDLDALDGQRGFRIEHARADEAVLLRMPNDFLGGTGTDLVLAINEVTGEGSRSGGMQAIGSLQLLPDVAPPYPATLRVGRFTPQFPRLEDFQTEGAALLPAPLGDLRGSSSRPTLGLRGNTGIYLIHGRESVPASGTIQALASGPDGQTLALPTGAQRIVAIGDINGDGRPDAAVAAPPRAHILLGRSDGSPMVLGPVIQAAHGATGLQILQIAGAGDLNGDGFDDLVVRGRSAAGHALWLVPGSSNFGSVQVPGFGQVQIRDPFGGSCREEPPLSGQIVCDPNGSSAELAESLEFINGPLGSPENFQGEVRNVLILAAPGSDSGLAVLFEAPTLAAAEHPLGRLRIPPMFPGDRTGQGLAVLEDFDGNGGRELAIGMPGADVQRTGTGRVAILHGRLQPGTLSLAAAGDRIQWLHGQQDQRVGWRLSDLDDIDGDGLSDLAVSAPSVGRTYVVFGSERVLRSGLEPLPPEPPTLAVYSSAEGPGETQIRRSAGVYNEVELLPAGDFDGDGREDVLIGQPSVQALDAKAARRAGRGASVAGEGAIALLLSGATEFPQEFTFDQLPPGAVRIRRADDPDQPLAVAYAAGGDYNGDGRTDLAFLSASLGRIAIVFGRPLIGNPMAAFLDPFRDADATLSPCGTVLRLANLGDVDGDGFDDLGVLCAATGTFQPSELAIRFGSANGFSGVSSIQGVQSIGSTPSIGRVRLDGSGADSFVLAQEGGGATIVFGGAHMRSNPVPLSGHTLRLRGSHLSSASAVRVVGLGEFDDLPGDDIGIAHSPTSRDGSPVGHVEILSGRASFPALLDLRTPPAGVIQGRVVLRGSGVQSITGLDSLSDRNDDFQRELLISLGEAEGHAPGSGKVFVLHGFPLPGVGATTAVREIDDVVPIGAGLTIRNGTFGSEALVHARSIRNFEGGFSRDAIGFGAQTDDLRGLTARKGRLLILRGSALPPP